ncbi:MAG: flagellar FliJ family protein [Alphaproteobacteria bacterium]|nr:flagellar FliJ family protein [Alphaproteobacteria bacterium]
MSRNLIRSLVILSKLEQQAIDELRVKITILQNQIDAIQHALDAQQEKRQAEFKILATASQPSRTFSIYIENEEKKRQDAVESLRRFEGEYGELQDKLRDHYGTLKGYESLIEKKNQALVQEEKKAEQTILDEIALNRIK